MKREHYQAMYRNELTHWWYKARRELVHKLIQEEFPNNTNLRILDIGCGTGALTKELEQYGEVVGVDFSSDAVEYCKQRGLNNVQQGSAEATGCMPESFDIVLCLDVLEHLKEDTKGIMEIKRVLKEGGITIVFVPTFMFLWGDADETSHHFIRYRLPELVQKFSANAFTVKFNSYFNTLLFFPIAIVRIFSRIFHFDLHSEIGTGNGLFNKIFYKIFSFERIILKHTRMPFGVSGMIIAKK